MGLQFKKKPFAILIACILLSVSSFFLFGILLNSDISKTYISNYISGKTSSKLNIHDFTVNLLPVPGITLRQTQYDDDFGSVFFDAIVLVLNRAELLKGKILLDEVVISHPRLILSDKPNQKKAVQPFNFNHGIKDTIFDTFFSYLPSSQDSIDIRVVNLKAPFLDSLDAEVSILKKNRLLKIHFDIKGVSIPFEDLPDPVKAAIHFKSITAEKISGTITSDKKNRLSIDTDLKKIAVLNVDQKPLLKTQVLQASISMDNTSVTAQIKPFKAVYPQMTASARLLLSLKGKESYLQINGSGININQARNEALKLLSDNKTNQELFEIIRGGHCPAIEIEFKSQKPGNLFNDTNMHLKGSLEKGVIKIPATHLIASGVKGAARVENGILYISADNGTVAGSNILSGDLAIDLVNYNDVPFNGEFLLDVDLSVLPETLIRLLPDTLLAHEMAMVDKVKGRTTATLFLSLETGKDLDVGVVSENLSLTGQYERIPGEIRVDNVRFELEPGVIRLRNLKGIIDAGTFDQVNADIDLNDPVYFDISSGSVVADLSQAIEWLNQYQNTRDLISPFTDGSGIVSIDNIVLSGPVLSPDQWRYNIKGSASDAGLSEQKHPVHGNPDQIKNISLDFDITDTNKTVENISFYSKDLNWLDSLVSKELIGQIKVPVSVQSGAIKTMNDSTLIIADIFTGQDTMAGVSLSGPSIDHLSIKELILKDDENTDVRVKFADHFEKITITDFSGKFNTQSYKNYLNPAGSWSNMIGKMTADQEMTIEKIKDNQIYIKMKTLWLDPLLSNSDWVSTSSDNQKINSLNIDFEADHVLFRKLDLTRVKSRIHQEKEGLFVDVKEADLCGVNTHGDIRIKNGLINVEFPFSSGTRENIQPLLTCLIGPDKFMDGRYALDGRLSLTGTFKNIKQHLNGRSKFRAEDGRIYKLTLLSRILSVINVSNVFKGKIPDITQTGFSYKSIVIDARIENSIIHLDKAVIDGTDMTMLFTGTIDLVKDELNLNCLVAPFKTIDLILKKIPIVNTMLEGRLISVPVKAAGKISDPVVIPLHPSSVGTGLINMMSGILKTPVKLLDKITTTDDQKEHSLDDKPENIIQEQDPGNEE